MPVPSPGRAGALPRWRRARRACILLACAFVSLFALASQAKRHEVTEVRLFSALLYKFTHFAEWPPGMMAAEPDALSICVIARDELAEVLEQDVRGRKSHDRVIEVRRLGSLTEAGTCHVLFVGWSTPSQIENVIGLMGQLPTLVVGATEGFAHAGGMINLERRGSRMAFEINRDAVDRSGIQLSSQLLKLADLVDSPGTD